MDMTARALALKAISAQAGKADLVDGKVPASELPSYVDDVVEYANTSAFPAEGERGKIYIALDTNTSYRWGGSTYIAITGQSDWNQSNITALDYIKNKPTLGTAAAKDMDSALSSTSTNPVQNSTLYDKFLSIDANIAALRLMMDATVYGFRIDKTNSDPETRVEYLYDAAGMTPARMNYTTGQFDYGSWANAWFITGNKPCALKYDGTIDYYLDPDDYTKKADGTASDVSDANYDGNFMASMPTVWVKRWEDARYQYTAIANKQIDDDFKAYAHDAGDGFINDYIYYPMFLGYIDSTKMRSIAGETPSGMTTTTEEKEAAEAVGTGWQMWDWSKHMLITDLLTLISHSTNSQTAFGYGAVDTKDDTDEQTHGMLSTGSDDLNTGAFYGYDDMLHHVKVFHIEDYWGNRFNRCLGLNRVDGYYMCKPVRPYSVAPDSSYINVGVSPSSGGLVWIKDILANEYGEFPISVGASSTTYFCDVINIGVYSTNSIAMIGGPCGDTYYPGSYALHISRQANNALWFVGSSLCYSAVHTS